MRHGAELDDGQCVTAELVRRIEDEELDAIRAEVGDEFFYSQGRPQESRELFEEVALSERYADYLTLRAYERLED